MTTKRANRNTAKYNVERQYIVFFDSEFNLSWNESDVKRFCEMWNKGVSVQEIARIFNRHPVDVILLVIDLAEQEKIEHRPSGIYGLQVTST